MTKQTVLYLQLPSLDNEADGPRENVPLAGIYLQYALGRSGERAHYAGRFLPASADDLDNDALVDRIVARRPAVLACTLYLWNIERTLRVAQRVRARLPGVRVVAGGPEASRRHPFLFRQAVADAVVVGEGEAVFPDILHALRQHRRTNFTTVAWRVANGYVWGAEAPPPVILADALPPAHAPRMRPDAAGMAYLETMRGCPMRCAFCRYHQLRRGVNALAPGQVAARMRALAARGAREIKFIDPTFNAHPQFDAVLEQIAAANPGRKLKLFAELRAEQLTAGQADRLAAAGFVEVEVGMQSRDPAVLRCIRRPTRLDALERGVQWMTRRGIRVTLDVMYGLPLQHKEDVYDSLRWALLLRGVRVQAMQTLLIPGTDLRRDAARWKMRSTARPPYGVLSTATMNASDILALERFVEEHPRLPSDVPTRRFVGRDLPGLFDARVKIDAPFRPGDRALSGGANCRAVLLRGDHLFEQRLALGRLIAQAVRREPDTLWQFVLCPRAEEPLDLLEYLAERVKRLPPHLLDRYAGPALSGRLVSRRILVQLSAGHRYSRSWVDAAEELLRRLYY
jgi:radical SAM superfamily enzyme YgiQ (UPF0313 family)